MYPRSTTTHPPVFDGSLPKVHHISVKADGKRKMHLTVEFHIKPRGNTNVNGKD